MKPRASPQQARLFSEMQMLEPDVRPLAVLSGHSALSGPVRERPGQERIDLAHGPAIDEAVEDLSRIGLGIDTVEFASLDQ
jgi:hypothetical protein